MTKATCKDQFFSHIAEDYGNAFEYCQHSIHIGYYKLIDNFDLKQ